jgi:hypothetical protein
MTETRKCEQCGTLFAPRREHARFCSARCRVAWNRQHAGDPPAAVSALGWTITAMRDTIDRLLRARASDQPHGYAAISEAVWWVTMVDATLVRYHPDVYDAVLESYGEAERGVIEGTFGGLRFVRNWMGYHLDHSDFIEPQCTPGSPGAGPIAAWTWRPLPEPVLAALPERGREWEMTRYREYQARLAARPVGETFDRAAAFLLRASADGALNDGASDGGASDGGASDGGASADGASDTLRRDRPGHVTASGMA